MIDGANNELRLISKIIETQDVNNAIRAGITPNVLANPIARTMFQDILNYFHNREHYGRIPQHRWMKKRFPGSYHKLKIEETIGELCAAIREVAMKNEINDAIQEVSDLNSDNPAAALERLRAAILQIGRMTPKSTDRTLADDADDIIARATMRRDSKTILGIPFPWDELNDLTQGMQTEDFIVLFGRPKCVVEGQRVLTDTGELQPIEAPTRWIAHLADEQKLRWGGCSGTYAGEKESIRITTRSGHVVEVGEDHPILQPGLHCTPAGQLETGDFVGVARKLPAPTHPQNISGKRARLLGIRLGNSSCAEGETQHTKRVPKAIFRCDNATVATFLSGYLDASGKIDQISVNWTAANYKLALDIKHLLLRFGVTGSLQKTQISYDTNIWYLTVCSQKQQRILNTVLRLSSQRKAESLSNLTSYSRAYQLPEWTDGDIRWESVKSIERIGRRRCWDITMDNGEQPIFMVENVLVHNSMKSWISGKLCSHAYLHGNCRVLVYSCEMSTALFEDRVACTIHDLNYERLKQGTLGKFDWYLYQEALHALKEDELRDAVDGRHRSIKFCSAFDDPLGGGMAHLLAKAEEFDPDLIIVDSFYKMKDDRSGKRSVKWEVQYNIVQDLKGVTQLLHIPVIGVTQRHRSKKEESDAEEEDLGDIAYADAVGQEADAIYRVKKDGMLADGRTVQLKVSMAGSRETRVGGFLLHVLPSTSWKLDSWLNADGKVVDDPLNETSAKDPSKRGGSLNAARRGGKKKEGEKGSKQINVGKLPAGSSNSLGVERGR